jgi:ketosteroid isomerase-like protein
MATEPRELIPEFFAAYNEGGATGFIDYLVERDALHPDLVMEIQRDAPNGGQWRGPEGFRDMSRRWLEVWEEFEILPEEDPIEVAEGRYVVPVRQRVVARGSGLEIEESFIYTVEFAEGRVWRIGLFVDRPRADRYLAGEGY